MLQSGEISFGDDSDMDEREETKYNPNIKGKILKSTNEKEFMDKETSTQ